MYTIRILLLAFLLLGVYASNTFRIGLTLANSCHYNDFVEAATNGITFWQNFASQSDFLLNGTQFSLQIISYFDGGDPNVAAILYERLILVEKVHVLFSPLYPPIPGDLAFEVASTYGIPVINYADGSYPTRFPNKLKWIFTLPPKAEDRTQDCLQFFKQKGANSIAVSIGEETKEFLNDTISGAEALGFTLPNLNSIPFLANEANDSTIDAVAKEVVSAKADVILGGGIDELNVPFLQKLLINGARPKAFFFWFGATFSTFRMAAGIAAINSFTSAFWTRADHYADPVFFPTATDAASTFSTMFYSRFGYYPSSLEAVSAAAVEIAMLAAKQAQSLDPEQLRLALLSINTSTFFANINFANAHQQLDIEWECYQLLQSPSGDVYETENKSLMLWPATPPVSRCYPKTKCASSRGKWIGIGFGIAFGVLLLAVLGSFLCLRHRYHVVVVSKDTTGAGEWANS